MSPLFVYWERTHQFFYTHQGAHVYEFEFQVVSEQFCLMFRGNQKLKNVSRKRFCTVYVIISKSFSFKDVFTPTRAERGVIMALDAPTDLEGGARHRL